MSQTAIERILGGDVRAMARAISAIENREPQGTELLKLLFPHSGRALMAGFTGAPGAGKSTLVDRVAAAWRQAGKTLGIIAVDPSSPFSGGAILGDRIRMQGHANDPGIYIRSMATRGALGGLASATSDAALLLDAAGREVILIETVGVGQDEIDIARLADVVVLLLVPGMGDDVQTIKAGIMEIADIFVINKSDRPGADRLEQEVRALLSIAPRADGWQPPIVRTVATEGRGAEQVRAAVERYASFTREGGLGERKRIERWRDRLLALLRDRLLQRVLATSLSDASCEAYARRIATRELDPYSVVDEVLRKAGL